MYILFINACDNEPLFPEHRLRKINEMEVKSIRTNNAKRLDTVCACVLARVCAYVRRLS